MDREQFDALARLVWTKSSRRTALGTILGAALLGSGSALVAAKPKPKDKRQRKRKRSQRQQRRDGPCYPNGACRPGRGQNNAGCNFSRTIAFFELEAHGSKLNHTNFTGAVLAQADLRGADLGGACLVGANLLDAVIDNSTNLKDAIFCRTLMPDGTVNDSGCGKGTRCCPTPDPICAEEPCEGDDCIRDINRVCSIFGTPCCFSLWCSNNIFSPFLT
ncbi:MAG: pentapeptide repeat-containing protein, partial [Thermomicrobiales bacterium]